MHHHVVCIIVYIIVYDMTRHRSCIITMQSILFTHFCTYHSAQTIVHHFTYTTATLFLHITNIFAYYFKTVHQASPCISFLSTQFQSIHTIILNIAQLCIAFITHYHKVNIITSLLFTPAHTSL